MIFAEPRERLSLLKAGALLLAKIAHKVEKAKVAPLCTNGTLTSVIEILHSTISAKP